MILFMHQRRPFTSAFFRPLSRINAHTHILATVLWLAEEHDGIACIGIKFSPTLINSAILNGWHVDMHGPRYARLCFLQSHSSASK